MKTLAKMPTTSKATYIKDGLKDSAMFQGEARDAIILLAHTAKHNTEAFVRMFSVHTPAYKVSITMDRFQTIYENIKHPENSQEAYAQDFPDMEGLMLMGYGLNAFRSVVDNADYTVSNVPHEVMVLLRVSLAL